jgi:hypothetical protein
MLFNHGQFKASTKSILQKQTGAKTQKLALGHDTNPIAKNISFIHIMSGQNNNFVSSIIFEHVPHLPTS